MGAVFSPQRRNARVNFDLDTAGNRIYLGTYFPKSVIESWCITSELLSIPLISSAFRQKEVIRLLDVGSGTGAAVVGVLLALADWGECKSSVEVTSLDINEDALAKQGEILDSLKAHLPFELIVNFHKIRLPFELDGFVANLSTFAEQEGHKYDIVTCWKCLSEFYNVNFAQAQGIIRNMVRLASSMLVPNGLCVVNDVTTTDNNYEFFACTLNREVNEHDVAPDAEARTILPLPCGKSSSFCTEKSCYTQRRFRVSHKLAPYDQTKTAYRILAPIVFAQSITASFNNLPAYGVNAAKPKQGCFIGRKKIVEDVLPCGYTAFFAKEE
jgi:SAM-dependent methyltransferase